MGNFERVGGRPPQIEWRGIAMGGAIFVQLRIAVTSPFLFSSFWNIRTVRLGKIVANLGNVFQELRVGLVRVTVFVQIW